jgi:hypothetical protein
VAPAVLGACTLVSVVLLLAADACRTAYVARFHDLFGALALGLIAFAYLAYQSVRRPSRMEMLKALLLSVAFLLWAANQMCPNTTQGTLFNDFAIALFVLDVYWIIVGWPSSPSDSRRTSLIA